MEGGIARSRRTHDEGHTALSRIQYECSLRQQRTPQRLRNENVPTTYTPRPSSPTSGAA